MRIVAHHLGIIGGRLPRSVGNANARWRERHSVLLVLRDDQGHLGLGEAAPLPGYSPETLRQAKTALTRAVRPLDAVDQRSVRAFIAPLAATPSAAFALETAILDLIAQRRRLSLAALLSRGNPSGLPAALPLPVEGSTSPLALLKRQGFRESPPLAGGGRPAGRRGYRGSIRRSGLLDGAPGTWPEQASGLIARGIKTLKLKVGRPGQAAQEVRGIAELRQQLGPTLRLRVDANGAWSPAEAALFEKETRPLRLQLIEQPCAPGALGTFPLTTPWAADESLRNEEDARRLARSSCSAFVLKPTVLGGLQACVRLAASARSRGKATFASHTFEGPVALEAVCALALAVGTPSLAAGVDTHGALPAWPRIASPHMTRPGFIDRPLGPRFGLGFSQPEREEIASWIS